MARRSGGRTPSLFDSPEPDQPPPPPPGGFPDAIALHEAAQSRYLNYAFSVISTAKYEVTGRGGKVRELLQPGQFVRIAPNQLEAPGPLEPS